MNVVVLQGKLSRPPVERTLASGAELANYEVTTRPDEGRSVTVPVAWFDPGREAASLDAGDEVVVVGHVARRFYAAGGATQSRTEVVATLVARVTQRRKIERAVVAAVREVADLAPDLALACAG